jgi:hypothetical protein
VTQILESADGWLPPAMPAGTAVQPVGRRIVEYCFVWVASGDGVRVSSLI